MNAFAVVTRGLRGELCGMEAAESTLECVDAVLAQMRQFEQCGWAVRLVPPNDQDCDAYGLASSTTGELLLLRTPLEADLAAAADALSMQEALNPPDAGLRIVGIKFLMHDDREEALCG